MVLNDVDHSPCKVYSLTWSEFGTSLTTAVRNLRNHEDLTDVTVSAGGKIFSAHKLILSAASPLLMELLKNAKCQHPILMLAGISSSDFETILDFVYRGEINIDSDKLPSLLQAAELLDIQALSPNALVLNSPVSVNINEDAGCSFSNATSNKNEIISNKFHANESESTCNLLKRKRESRSVESVETSSTSNSCKKSYPSGDLKDGSLCETASLPVSKTVLPANINDLDNQEDEKKIISDLPVNCKLCGVTIRQSRNLRRHIDHMHLKQKLRSQSKDLKDGRTEEKVVLNTFKGAISGKKDDLNNNPSSSTVLNFSEDSFTQLTEEILNCASGSTSATSNENSLSSSGMQLSDTSSNNTNPAAESLPSGVEMDSRSPISSTAVQSTERLKPSALDSRTSVETFDCSNLDDSCNMNDITLKELENQLFSVCFCSAENEDV